MGHKSQQDPFSTIFTKKFLLLCPNFIKKRPFPKKITYLSPIFCQKYFHSLKNNVFHVIFFSILYEKPPAVTPIFGPKKHQFCQTYTILLAKKVNSKPFFSQFTKKSFLSRHMTKMSILYKSTCSHAHIWSKKCPFFRKHGSLMSFFQIFMKNQCCHAHIWSEKC